MQFVADVSHELRTPLTVIQGNIELLQRSESQIPSKDREAMQDVVEETKNISHKLENLINLIHEGAEPSKIRIQQFEFSKIIAEVLSVAKRLAREKKIKIIIRENPKLDFFGDREKIKEMFLNILTNAVKYNQYQGQVIISIKILKDNISVEVKDTGIGIARADLPFVFDRFYRAKEIERFKKRAGSGIGLAVSRFIAKAHGGDIKVKSRVGQGTQFTVILP